MMHIIQFKRKRVFITSFVVIIVYFLLRPTKFNFNASINLHKTPPSQVWEFVADFSNMKYLNPTILHFKILAESGNYNHWKYSTEYTENLSHWPYISNVAVAHFDVKGESKKDIYEIISTHKTCMLLGLICVHSDSEFTFRKISKEHSGTFCEENVNYECPPLLYLFCKREVQYQRTEIMQNLKKQFG